MPQRYLGYVPALDGLRALAALAVLAFHSEAPFANGGWLGVDIFFVLSGFLLGSIHIERRPRYREYLARRLWRILPPMAALAVVVVAIWPHTFDDAVLALTALSPWSFAANARPSLFLHTWSLGVELAAYALLPLLLRAAKRPARVLLLLAGLSWLWRCAIGLWLGLEPAYYVPIGRMDGLLFGAAIALWYRSGKLETGSPRLIFALLATLMLLTPGRVLPALLVASPAVTMLAGLLVAALAAGALPWLGTPALVWLGQRSYGIYLWHYPVAVWGRSFLPWPITTLLALAVSVVLADLTYRLLERPIARHTARRPALNQPAVSP